VRRTSKQDKFAFGIVLGFNQLLRFVGVGGAEGSPATVGDGNVNIATCELSGRRVPEPMIQ